MHFTLRLPILEIYVMKRAMERDWDSSLGCVKPGMVRSTSIRNCLQRRERSALPASGSDQLSYLMVLSREA